MSNSEPGSIGKKLFFVLIIGGALIFSSLFLRNLPRGDFYLLGSFVFSEKLFIESSKNFLTESSKSDFIDNSSIIVASSPFILTSNSSLGVFGGGAVDQEHKEDEAEIIEYIVKEGDIISAIASKFNISTKTILWANNLHEKSVLKVGGKITILPVSGVLHEVKENDTTTELAKKYKVKTEDIISFNNIIDETIYIGDILIIPGGEMPVSLRPAAPAPTPSAGFISPTKGVISQGLHHYNAIDIANSCGTPIVASASGTVQRTGYHSIGGHYIRIIHAGNVVTYYGHLSRIIVSPGQKVSQGSIIGYMGNTGYTIGRTGCHIHFEVRGASNPLSRYRVGHRF